MAQGAEHSPQDKLKKIVDLMKSQMNNAYIADELVEIADRFNISHANIGSIYLHNNMDYVAEEKYDGYSYLNDEGRFFSKRLSEAKGNEGQPIEKTGHIPHLAKIMKMLFEQLGIDVHGELFKPGGISDDVTKIMGCTADEAVRRQLNDENKLHFMLIDIRKFNGINVTNEPYYIRRALLEHVYNYMVIGLKIDDYVHIAPVLYGDPCIHFKRIVLSGGEGIIIKNTKAVYTPGKKPAGVWIKGKKKITVDVIIMGYNSGTGKNKQLFGSIEFGMIVDGKLKKMGQASSGLDDSTRAMIAQNPDRYLNTVMEIESIQESKNSFRNAVFLRLRDDKSYVECTLSPSTVRIKEDLV